MRHFGDMEKKGYRFRASIPERAAEGRAFRVTILHGRRRLHEFRVPMSYEPRFGPDASDVRALEDVTAAVIKLLPAPEKFGKDTIKRIDAIVAKMS